MHRIRLSFSHCQIDLRLRNTVTANSIYDALPVESVCQTWGDEVYFKVPVNVALEHGAKDVVNAGEIAFWTEGDCIAIGFGPTPISAGDEIRLAAPTNIWADSESDVKALSVVIAGEKVSLEKLPDQ